MNVIRYEPVFGDQSLFDNAPEDVVIAIKDVLSTKKVYYFSKNGWIKNNNGRRLDCDVHQIAMRRIEEAPEPKRWTWEDKKAGRLPEVGIKCVWVNLSGTKTPDDLLYPEVGEEIEIVANTKTYDGKYPVSVFKWLHDDGETQCYAASGHVEDFNPIETPEEKAQREEDEFVEELASGVSRYDRFISGVSRYDSFINGARAAYRKLKGGE